MNGGVQSDLATLVFKNREQLEHFHSRIIIFQQEIILSGEPVSPKRLIFQHMKSFSKSNKTKATIVPNMTDFITLLENNRKYAVYTGENIHGLYCYIEII